MIISSLVLAALTWYPAPDWKDEPDPVASPLARKGGTVRFNGGQPPKSYNAYVDNNSYTMMTFELMYENLLSTDTETMEFCPGLARQWAISEDGREYTFVIDERAKWSDGRPVTAADVKWTFDAVMDPKSDTGPWKSTLGSFESPRVVDSHTVVIRKKGDSQKTWRDLLHCGFFPVLPSHAFRGRPFNSVSVVGMPTSGPYRLVRVDEQVESEFRRNPGWWRAGFPSARGVCNFNRIVLRYFAGAENAFEAFKKRSIDVYPVYSARIMSEGTKGEPFARNWIVKRSVWNREPVGFQGFAMNMRRPPFDKLEVRQAMAKLVDRETMNRTMMNNAYFLLSSYYTDLYDEAHPCANVQWTYDVEGAKRLLAKAGYAGGFSFTFLSRSSSEDKFLALFDHSLRECGITMKIVRKDFASWMRDMDSFSFDMTWAAWGASVFRNPEVQWHSAEGRRPGGNNVTGLDIPEVDRIIEQEKSMATFAERADAYRRIDKLVTDAVPYVLLWHTAEHRLLYWNKFGMPGKPLGIYGNESAILSYWWHDADRAEELKWATGEGKCLPTTTD